MFITIIDIERYMGIHSLKSNDILYLVKDIDNSVDDEAIKVISKTGVTYGYVANSVDTVARGTHSAGYIYDVIKDNQECRVSFILNGSAIAEVV